MYRDQITCPTAALVVTLNMVVLLEEEVFICAVGRKRNGRYAQAREGALEPVETAELTSVPP